MFGPRTYETRHATSRRPFLGGFVRRGALSPVRRGEWTEDVALGPLSVRRPGSQIKNGAAALPCLSLAIPHPAVTLAGFHSRAAQNLAAACASSSRDGKFAELQRCSWSGERRRRLAPHLTNPLPQGPVRLRASRVLPLREEGSAVDLLER